MYIIYIYIIYKYKITKYSVRLCISGTVLHIIVAIIVHMCKQNQEN